MRIEMREVVKRFGRSSALNGLTLGVNSGEIYGLLGPNGAGKSTALKIIVGLLRADEGEVIVDGRSIDEDPLEAKRLIGYVPELPSLPNYLTVREFLEYVGKIRGVSNEQLNAKIEKLQKSFEIEDVDSDFIANLSKGIRQRLTIVSSLLHSPEILVLDEPMMGLDPKAQRVLKNELLHKAGNSGAVIISTHLLDGAEKVCTRVGLIGHGRLIAEGNVSELKAQYGSSLEEAFLKITASS